MIKIKWLKRASTSINFKIKVLEPWQDKHRSCQWSKLTNSNSLCWLLASCRVIHRQRMDINSRILGGVVPFLLPATWSWRPFWGTQFAVIHAYPEHPQGVNSWHVWCIWPTVMTGRPSCSKKVPAHSGNVQVGIILLEGQMMELTEQTARQLASGFYFPFKSPPMCCLKQMLLTPWHEAPSWLVKELTGHTYFVAVKCRWQSQWQPLFPTLPSWLVTPTPPTHTPTSPSATGGVGVEGTISSWYTILPNWREITVSGATHRNARHKTMDGTQPN